MIGSIQFDHNISIEMRDGMLLAGDVYHPGDREKYPAILLRTPYHSDMITSGSIYIKVLPTVQSGYALVINCVRGRYGAQRKFDLRSSQDVEGAESIPASQTLYHQSGYASYIDLSVIPSK
jgi:predicted acyl esterase